MPEKKPPLYQWIVMHSGGDVRMKVDAAYSDVEPTGHMVLKNPDGNPVFTAEPGLGCTFERLAPVEAVAHTAFVMMLTGDEAEVARAVMNGKVSVNAGRRKLGLEPFADPEADKPVPLA